MNSLTWRATKKEMDLPSTEQDMIEAAQSWINMNWPKGVTMEILPGAMQTDHKITKTIYIHDPDKLLTYDQMMAFYDYMFETFPDLLE